MLALRALLVLAALAPAAAGAVTIEVKKQALITQFTAGAISTIRWTGWIEVSEWPSLAFQIDYTWSAGTAVTMRCETSDDPTIANDAGFDLHLVVESATPGTLDSYGLVLSNPVSAAEKWTWTVSNLPHGYINCGLTATGGDGSDVATVKRKRISP